ncbi:MAG: RNase adapter RapZ [Clostridia bacterium]|nr:RNase adapter RapZ [Clostridia bacterium]
MELLLVTGLSGAGKSQAADALEDMGFYCVDNIPPAIIPSFVDLSSKSGDELSKLAVVTDARGGDLFSDIPEVLENLKLKEINFKILFLDASNEVLIRRYKENRRKHPLMSGEKASLSEAVKKEREMLDKIRIIADYVVDTSYISNSQLKEKLTGIFSENGQNVLKIQTKSFGFKYGADTEADLVIDVRCLPNPFYIDSLKHKTGLDQDVRDYVMQTNESKEFYEKLVDFIDFSMPLYVKEGKSQLVIAFGCTGGKHRSVTFAELLAKHLKSQGYDCKTMHRDIQKR